VDAHTKTPVQTRHSAKTARKHDNHDNRRGHEHRTTFQRPWHAFHGPVLDKRTIRLVPTSLRFLTGPRSRPRAASAAALADLCEGHPLALLCWRAHPFSDRVPGCTRMVAWSPFKPGTQACRPGLIRNALANFSLEWFVWPPYSFTLECCNRIAPYSLGIPYILMSLTLYRLARGFCR